MATPPKIGWTLGFSVSLMTARQQDAPAGRLYAIAGLWSAAAIFMRPDNGLILAALGPALLVVFFRKANKKQVLFAGLVLAITSLGPLTPWAVRNWRVFHVW